MIASPLSEELQYDKKQAISPPLTGPHSAIPPQEWATLIWRWKRGIDSEAGDVLTHHIHQVMCTSNVSLEHLAKIKSALTSETTRDGRLYCSLPFLWRSPSGAHQISLMKEGPIYNCPHYRGLNLTFDLWACRIVN